MLVEQLLQTLIQLGAKATLLHVALQLPDKAAIVGGQAKDEPAVERVHAAGGAAEEGQHEDHEAAVEHIELWPRHIVGQPAEGKVESGRCLIQLERNKLTCAHLTRNELTGTNSPVAL